MFNKAHCQKSFLAFLLFIFLHHQSVAQIFILDSLKLEYKQASTDNQRIKILIEILSRSHSTSADSFYSYIKIGEGLVLPNTPEYFRIKNANASFLMRTGNIKEASYLIDSLLHEIPEGETYREAKYWLNTNKIGLLIRSSKSKDAIDECLKILKDAEAKGDELWIARMHVSLGWAHMELEKYSDAIKWLRAGLDYASTERIRMKVPFLFSNIASCYNNINQPDSAFHYINLALQYGQMDENLFQIANSLNIRADMFIKQKKFSEAESDLNEAIKIRQQIGDNLFIASDLAQLSSFYASINQPEKGIDAALKAIPLAEKVKSYSRLIFIYNALAENYKVAGMGMEYGNVMKKISLYQDSLFEKNSNEAIAALEAKYELQKKENIIMLQENKIIRNRYVTIGSIMFIVLISVLIGLFYRNRQLLRMQKMKTELTEQKMKAAEEIRMAQEIERKRIAADLHDNLGAYAAAITNNVKALREKIVDESIVTENLEENANNIVTQLSDTIWVLKNEQLHFTNLADRFKTWMQRLMKNYPEVKYDFSENIVNDVAFTPANILHLFYILKECANNALRHSKCTEIKIDFLSDEKLSVIISDNGNGIKDNDLKGNGIENVKKRADVCGWNVVWSANQPQGTRIMLSATTK